MEVLSTGEIPLGISNHKIASQEHQDASETVFKKEVYEASYSELEARRQTNDYWAAQERKLGGSSWARTPAKQEEPGDRKMAEKVAGLYTTPLHRPLVPSAVCQQQPDVEPSPLFQEVEPMLGHAAADKLREWQSRRLRFSDEDAPQSMPSSSSLGSSRKPPEPEPLPSSGGASLESTQDTMPPPAEEVPPTLSSLGSCFVSELVPRPKQRAMPRHYDRCTTSRSVSPIARVPRSAATAERTTIHDFSRGQAEVPQSARSVPTFSNMGCPSQRPLGSAPAAVQRGSMRHRTCRSRSVSPVLGAPEPEPEFLSPLLKAVTPSIGQPPRAAFRPASRSVSPISRPAAAPFSSLLGRAQAVAPSVVGSGSPLGGTADAPREATADCEAQLPAGATLPWSPAEVDQRSVFTEDWQEDDQADLLDKTLPLPYEEAMASLERLNAAAPWATGSNAANSAAPWATGSAGRRSEGGSEALWTARAASEAWSALPPQEALPEGPQRPEEPEWFVRRSPSQDRPWPHSRASEGAQGRQPWANVQVSAAVAFCIGSGRRTCHARV